MDILRRSMLWPRESLLRLTAGKVGHHFQLCFKEQPRFIHLAIFFSRRSKRLFDKTPHFTEKCYREIPWAKHRSYKVTVIFFQALIPSSWLIQIMETWLTISGKFETPEELRDPCIDQVDAASWSKWPLCKWEFTMNQQIIFYYEGDRNIWGKHTFLKSFFSG